MPRAVLADAIGLLRRLVGETTPPSWDNAHYLVRINTLHEARDFVFEYDRRTSVEPTPGPVPGRGHPATAEACAKVIEGCGAILGKDAASRIRAQFPPCTCDGYTCAACVEWFKYRATGIRGLTSPSDTKGRP